MNIEKLKSRHKAMKRRNAAKRLNRAKEKIIKILRKRQSDNSDSHDIIMECQWLIDRVKAS